MCSASHSGLETGWNVQSCWNQCTRADFYNMIWDTDQYPVSDCSCVNSKIDVDSCGEGEYEYYNANPADCIPGT